MGTTAESCNNFLEIVVGYLDLLHQQGIITDLGNIDTECVIAITEELRNYFVVLQMNDAA